MVPLWGPWTDKGGKRKPALQVGILGACLDLTVLLLVMYLNLSVYFLFLGAAISGFSGFAPVIMTGATSYIADVSSEEERTFRIGKGNLRAIYLCIIILFVLSEGSNTARQETPKIQSESNLPKYLKCMVSGSFIHALLLFLGLFLKISHWLPLITRLNTLKTRK